MEQYIDKSALVAEIERRVELNDTCQKISGGNEFYRGAIDEAKEILSLLDTLEAKEIGVDLGDPDGDKSAKYIIDTKTLEVKEMDIDKLCEFRKNIGFAYPEGASEYQKQLACYRQGIKDVIKAQKG